jgi:hypothetical protein
MMRCLFAFVAFMVFLPFANATIALHKEPARREEVASRAFAQSLPVRAEDRAYQITEETEILLNGRKCQYHEVPNTATIIHMEIDSEDSRIILCIHFRDRK